MFPNASLCARKYSHEDLLLFFVTVTVNFLKVKSFRGLNCCSEISKSEDVACLWEIITGSVNSF